MAKVKHGQREKGGAKAKKIKGAGLRKKKGHVTSYNLFTQVISQPRWQSLGVAFDRWNGLSAFPSFFRNSSTNP
jgi:hypothetical protein